MSRKDLYRKESGKKFDEDVYFLNRFTILFYYLFVITVEVSTKDTVFFHSNNTRIRKNYCTLLSRIDSKASAVTRRTHTHTSATQNKTITFIFAATIYQHKGYKARLSYVNFSSIIILVHCSLIVNSWQSRGKRQTVALWKAVRARVFFAAPVTNSHFEMCARFVNVYVLWLCVLEWKRWPRRYRRRLRGGFVFLCITQAPTQIRS